MSLQEIIEQLESCGFTCEAGPLKTNAAFQVLKERSQNRGLAVDVSIRDTEIFKKLLELLYRIVSTTTDEKVKDLVLDEISRIVQGEEVPSEREAT
ncbi:hypothetical protein [Bacillus sp. 3255]|uniref:hypothetical protein n=1 Tax=Bacillus sp. 3255 TaxID=2817904 RepID=UPI0037BFBBF4